MVPDESLDAFLSGTNEASRVEARDPEPPRRPPGLENPAGVSGGSGLRSEGPLETTLPRPEAAEPWWTCFSCQGEAFSWEAGGWRCALCGSRDYYNRSAPTRRATPSGTWLYIPRGDPEPNDDDTSSTTSRRPSTLEGASPTSPWRSTGPVRAGGPAPQEWNEGAGREQAESEAATNDVTVDPETLEPVRRLSRRQRRAAAAASRPSPEQGPPRLHDPPADRRSPEVQGPGAHRLHDPLHQEPASTWRGKLLKDMGEALGNRRDGSDGLWSASKGPKPGVKYRGGTPPAPPQWTYAREDVRAFDRYERKVRMWERQVQAFMPKREAAMALYVSLRGEAEEELEFMAFDEIDCEHGLENILAALRRPLQTREVYLKRRYLHEYEYIGRQANESIRSFCNRYQRTEKSLLATGINVAAMYDGESRGSRLLDRMRLTMEQQRLILVSTGQSLQFDAIRDAAQLQYPEHRPVPAVAYNREFENNHRTPDHRDHPKGGKSGRDSGKGSKGPKGGKGPRQPYRTYVTEEASAADYDEDPAETLADIPEDEAEHDQDEDEELIPDDSVDPEDGDDIQTVMKEVADCLTVTARRLQGVTLGRKFTTNPKNKDLEQRKRNSHCAACGQKGHWQGDDACPVSAKGAKGAGKSSHGNSAKGDSSKKGGAPKKVLNVSFHGSPDTEPTFEPEPPTAEELQEYGSYFTTFMTTFAGPSQDVFLSKPGDFAGFAVLDTACQRSLCSEKWLVKHRELLAQHKLDVKSAPESEGFQFGTGPIQVSKRHVFFPVCLDGSLETCALFGASVMEYPSDIPLLLSLGMLSKKLKAILDLPRNVAYLGVFNVEVPIIKINGHVCIELNRLPKGHFAKWKAMSSILDQGEPDSELLTPSPLPATTANACAAAATGMASGMAPRRQVHLGGGTSPSSLPEPDGAPRPSQAVLAVAPGPHAPALDGQYDKGAAGPVRAPCSHAGQEREPPRKLPKVLPVQHPVEVGSFRVGRAAIFAIAAAVTTLGQLWGQDTLGGQASARTGGPGGHGNMLGQPIGDWFEAQAEAFAATPWGTGLHRGGARDTGPRARSASCERPHDHRQWWSSDDGGPVPGGHASQGGSFQQGTRTASAGPDSRARGTYAWDLVQEL